MQLPATGLGRDAVLSTLERYRVQDMPWRDGRVFAYNYEPTPDARHVMETAYLMYLGENALDFTTVPSVMRLEREVVRMMINLMRGEESVVGNLTSGGTESCMLAVKTARDRARALFPHITQPEMIVPRTAHSAFYKAAAYFDVKPVAVGYDPETFRVNVAEMRSAITPNTILLVASAPGYGQGVIDPIAEIGQLALERGLLFHVDACVGGIHFALMRRMGYELPNYDWTVPGVTSISADLHKFGYAAKNVSCIMYRSKDIRRYQIFACAQNALYALVNPTILSSKSGGPAAGAWAILNYLGENGYENIVRPVVEATNRLIDGINGIPELRVLGKPEMCMFAFTSDTFNIFQLADEIRLRGWYVQPQFSTELSPENLHMTVSLQTVPNVEAFLTALRESVEAVKQQEPLDLRMVREQVQALTAGGMNADTLATLEAMAGLGGDGQLPTHMALLNSVLDALPDELTEQLLVSFVNELYV